jgi:hypothetical protein
MRCGTRANMSGCDVSRPKALQACRGVEATNKGREHNERLACGLEQLKECGDGSFGSIGSRHSLL